MRIFGLIVSVLLLTGCATNTTSMAASHHGGNFDAGWKFTKGDPAGVGDSLSYNNVKSAVLQTPHPQSNPGADVAYVKNDFDDSQWRGLTLPHDWGIEGPFKMEYPGKTGKLPWWGIAWYRKHFVVSPEDAGKHFFLDFDGAMSYSMVWINGHFVGGEPYGYESFRVDLSPYIQVGKENVVAVRLDNPPDSSRWYPGGGIYRNVWLVKTNDVHVDHWGTYVTTSKITPASATVHVRTNVVNESSREANVVLHNEIFDGGSKVAAAEPEKLTLAKSSRSEQDIPLANPKLWDLKSPHRYTLVTTVERDGQTIDRYETPFGVRSIAFDPNNGFLLNGKHVLINGVCDHHDLGALGAAVNISGLRRQIQILQEMGCNAIRTSHNPPAPELLDLCDEMGMLVMDEAFDCWVKGKTANDYHLIFHDWHDRDWRSQIRRDRNHPCVILWSIGNEIPEQGDVKLHYVAADLTKIAREEDPTRPTSAGCNNVKAARNGFQKTIDVYGYNYRPWEYKNFHVDNRNQSVIGSETASTVSSRGIYVFPVSNDQKLGLEDHQVSSYDLSAPRWATTPDVEFKNLDENPNVAGEFVWTGFDYLGEPTPYNQADAPSRSSYFGIVDLCGFKKDRFYLYQAHWRPELPMAHIVPHWTWPDRVGQVTPVHVYTSGDEAELFINGKSVGRKKKGPGEYRLRWDDVKYEPGEVRVIAYKNGKRWAEDVQKTAGPAATLVAAANRKTIAVDGRDLAFVTVEVHDKNGTLVPQASNRIHFSVEGPGEIVATDNGDATNLEVFSSHDRNVFNGMAMVIVRAKAGEAGAIKVIAKSNGVATAIATVTSK